MSRVSFPEDIYLLPRDEVESERLNRQHRLLTTLMGNQPIFYAIPMGQIKAVADVATGTGVWLESVSRMLPDSIPPPYLHGFDISPAQFPRAHVVSGRKGKHIPLSVHNALHRFPAEHRGCYDLVHLRLLTAGLKREDYSTVIENAQELLKPNGYIQWEDINNTLFCTDHVPDVPAIATIKRTFTNGMIMAGLTPFAPQKIIEELNYSKFRNIRQHIFTTKGKDELHDAAVDWATTVIPPLLTSALLVNGEARDEAEAKVKIDELIAEFKAHCQTAMPLINLHVIIAQL